MSFLSMENKSKFGAMNMTLTIPVKPYIKAWLDRNYFLKGKYLLTSTDPVGIVLLALLQPVPKVYIKPNGFMEGMVEIVIDLGANKNVIGTPHLDERHWQSFNTSIEYFLLKDFYFYVETKCEAGCRKNTAIREFQDKYDMADCFDFETLKKKYYRYQKRMDLLKKFYL